MHSTTSSEISFDFVATPMSEGTDRDQRIACALKCLKSLPDQVCTLMRSESGSWGCGKFTVAFTSTATWSPAEGSTLVWWVMGVRAFQIVEDSSKASPRLPACVWLSPVGRGTTFIERVLKCPSVELIMPNATALRCGVPNAIIEISSQIWYASDACVMGNWSPTVNGPCWLMEVNLGNDMQGLMGKEGIIHVHLIMYKEKKVRCLSECRQQQVLGVHFGSVCHVCIPGLEPNFLKGNDMM